MIETLLSRELASERNQVEGLIGSAEWRDAEGDPRFDAMVRKHLHA